MLQLMKFSTPKGDSQPPGGENAIHDHLDSQNINFVRIPDVGMP